MIFDRFFAKTGLGIDISARSIEICLLSGSHTKPKLSKLIRCEIPGGAIEKGQLLIAPLLKSAIDSLITQLKDARVSNIPAVVTIPDLITYSAVITLTLQEQALPLEAKQSIL